MNETDSMLRWRRAMREGTQPGRDRSGCPPPERLALLATDPDSAPATLLDHVERCSACSEELRAASDCDALEELVDELAPRRRWRVVPWAAAASVLLAVALVVLLPPPETGEITRSGGVDRVTPAEGAVLDAAPTRFSWSGDGTDDPEVRFRVTVFDAEAERIWQSEPVTGDAVELPTSVRRRLLPGGYFWELQIVETGTSRGPYRFEIDAGGDRR